MALQTEVQEDFVIANFIDNNFDETNTSLSEKPHVSVGEFKFSVDRKHLILVEPPSTTNRGGESGKSSIVSNVQQLVGEVTISPWVKTTKSNLGDDMEVSFEMLKELKRIVMSDSVSDPSELDWFNYVSKTSVFETTPEPLRFAYKGLFRYQFYTDV